MVFSRGPDRVEVHSGTGGRIRALLPPGTWKVDATAEGFRSYQGEFEVPPRTAPVYVEEVRVVRPEDEGDEITGLRIPLSR